MPLLNLPKQYHPDFRDKRTKPTGPVEVDTDNRFGRDLLHLWGFLGPARITDGSTSGQPCQYLWDMIGEAHPHGYRNDGADRPPLGAAPTGQGYKYTTGTTEYGGSHIDNDAANFPATHDGTLLFVGFLTDVTNDALLLGQSNYAIVPSYKYGCGLHVESGVIYAFRSENNETQNVNMPIATGPVVVAASFEGTSVRLSVNGKSVAGTCRATGTNYNFGLGMSAQSHSSSKDRDYMDGVINMCAMTNEVYTEGELNALTRDPYQVLRPKAPTAYFVSAGGPAAITILPTGFASSEAFGTADVLVQVKVLPTGFASSTAFGTTGVLQHITLTPTGFGSSETFGTADVLQHITVTPTGLSSSEALGTPDILFTGLVVTPTGFASSASFGTPDVLVGLAISPNGFASSEVFGTADVLVGLSIEATGFGSTEAFGATDIIIDGVITPSSIPSSEAFGATGVLVSLKLTPTGINSSENFGDITLVGEIFETPGGNMLVAYYTGVFEPYFEPYSNL